MNYKQIAARLTGLNCPVFGVSWNPPEAERTIARRVITALEDRRVLYVDSELEVPMRCVESVQRIRELLTQEIAPLADDAHIAPALRAIRTACRDFLNKVGRRRRTPDHHLRRDARAPRELDLQRRARCPSWCGWHSCCKAGSLIWAQRRRRPGVDPPS